MKLRLFRFEGFVAVKKFRNLSPDAIKGREDSAASLAPFAAPAATGQEVFRVFDEGKDSA